MAIETTINYDFNPNDFGLLELGDNFFMKNERKILHHIHINQQSFEKCGFYLYFSYFIENLNNPMLFKKINEIDNAEHYLYKRNGKFYIVVFNMETRRLITTYPFFNKVVLQRRINHSRFQSKCNGNSEHPQKLKHKKSLVAYSRAKQKRNDWER
jgi:hypothetical protein